MQDHRISYQQQYATPQKHDLNRMQQEIQQFLQDKELLRKFEMSDAKSTAA